MEFFRTWIVPPLIGAIIGYCTNWLAIKMLFRPLKPVMLGSWKLPFTPGILPRERERLSVSIGETVSRELLTTQVFAERLHDPYMISKVETSVSVLLEGILSMPLYESLAPILNKDESASEDAEPDLGTLACRICKKALTSQEFRYALSMALKASAEEILALPAEAILDRKALEKSIFYFAESCNKPEFRTKLLALFFGKLGTGAGKLSSTTKASFEPNEASSHAGFKNADNLLEQEPLLTEKELTPLAVLASDILYSKLLPVVNSIFEDTAIRKELESLAMKAVKGALNRLGPIQRLIVTAANYEKTLQNSMPETIEELSHAIIQLLASQTMKEKLVKAIAGYLAAMRFSGTDPASIGTTTEGLGWALQHESGFDTENPKSGVTAQSASTIYESFDRFLKEISEDAEGFSRRLSERYERFSGKRLAEFMPVLSADLAEGLSRIIVAGLASQDSGPRISGVFKAFIEGFIKANAGKSFRDVLSVSQEDIRQIARLVTRTILNALSAQSEQLLDALDIKTMVVDKMNALDMEDVERIILSVVHNELSWITFLGGALGALIGLFQSLALLL